MKIIKNSDFQILLSFDIATILFTIYFIYLNNIQLLYPLIVISGFTSIGELVLINWLVLKAIKTSQKLQPENVINLIENIIKEDKNG